ncbi:hypothetical protein HPP92_027441 [Vanilla planifolia]|uniref:Protein kinase domain-containing protein n=1 Tax=Vanilla planifolia TaxID=51239 RepID=A0A835U5N1_VANPL|nr:hypothetical protein HPP92_027441 [Vanilla planifolia]
MFLFYLIILVTAFLLKRFRGSYLGRDVAIKVLRSDLLNETMRVEFAQELMILREVQHRNVVRFVGACTSPPQFCIVTEYMHGGSLYDYLHKQRNVPELPLLLKFALDIGKGWTTCTRRTLFIGLFLLVIIKTLSLKRGQESVKEWEAAPANYSVVKVADFGVARFQNQGGVMTAETGTYRWMAPEIPYESMTPLQAALGVRQGLRPDIPENIHPKLLNLMQRCWETSPAKRPSFCEIIVELEEFSQHIQLHPSEETKMQEKDYRRNHNIDFHDKAFEPYT